MLGLFKHVFRQEMYESKLFGTRLLYGVDRADKAVLEARILLLNETSELRIGWRFAQRHDERFDDRRDNCGQQAKSQCGDRPPGNARRIRKCKTNQERNDSHAQNPSQASKPKKCLPS